jgi:hypothetical protein
MTPEPQPRGAPSVIRPTTPSAEFAPGHSIAHFDPDSNRVKTLAALFVDNPRRLVSRAG